MNLDVLRDEIVQDPLGRGYAAMTPQQLAASLNAKDREAVRPYTITRRGVSAVFGVQRAAEVRKKMEEIAANPVDPMQAVMREILFLLDHDGIDLAHRDAPVMLSVLVQRGIITAEESRTLLDLTKEYISRAAELGITDEVGLGLLAASGAITMEAIHGNP